MDQTVTLFPEWRQAVQDFLDMNPHPGFIVKKDWLMAAFGIDKPVTAEDQRKADLKYVQSVTAFRAALLEDHMLDLRAVIGVGYEVLAPKDQTRHAVDLRMKNVRSELRMMARQVSFVKLHELTDDERKENADAQAKLANLRALMTSTRLLPR